MAPGPVDAGGSDRRSTGLVTDVALRVASLSVVAASVAAMAHGAVVRRPWIDELYTLWFSQGPNELIERYHGESHPPWFYLQMLPVSVTDPPFWVLRTAALVIPTVIMVALCLPLVVDRRRWGGLLVWTAAPALLSVTVMAAFGGDFRMYGPLGTCTVVLAVTLWEWWPEPRLDGARRWCLVAAFAHLGSLTLWGAGAGLALAIPIVVRLDPAVRRRLVTPIVVLAPVVAAAWLSPLLLEDKQSLVDDVSVADLGRLVLDALGTHPVIGLAFVAAWAASALRADRRTRLVFHVPALTLVIVLGGFSVVAFPVLRIYSLVPVVALVVVGTAVWLQEQGSERARLAWVGLLAVAVVTNLPHHTTSRQDWAAAFDHLPPTGVADASCPVQVWPPSIDAMPADIYRPGLGAVAFEERSGCTSCVTEWVVTGVAPAVLLRDHPELMVVHESSQSLVATRRCTG